MKTLMVEPFSLPGGRQVYFADELSSTNDVAAQLGKEGAPDYTAVWADRQTKGRGRLGRSWQTYPDVGLAFSVISPQTSVPPPILVSVSLHRALSAFAAPEALERLHIKWPNDILIGDKKLSGILIESYPRPDSTSGLTSDNGRFYVLGIGLNVGVPGSGFEATSNAAALAEITDVAPERAFVLAAILDELEKTLDLQARNPDHASVIAYYKKHCVTFGKKVQWRDGRNSAEGVAKDMTPESHLLIQTAQGEVTCNVGDVILCGE